jgi:hypothetical protein
MTPEKEMKKRRFLELADRTLTRLIDADFYGVVQFDVAIQGGHINNAYEAPKRMMPIKIGVNGTSR